jgi:hypothetical protein
MALESQDQADETAEGQDVGRETETAEEPGQTAEELTPEMEKRLQSMADRMVTKALETQRKKLEKDTEARIESERKKLTEKQLAEQGKYQELAEQREAELAAIRADLAAKELTAQTVQVLADRGVPGLAKVFDADLNSIEGRIEAADLIKQIVDEAVESRVNDRLKTPGAPRGTRRTGNQTLNPVAAMNEALRNGDLNQAFGALDAHLAGSRQ